MELFTDSYPFITNNDHGQFSQTDMSFLSGVVVIE